MFNVEKKVLDNGLRVVLAPMENSEAVTIQMLVGVGSKNETKEISGISHFLEHMFLKGTSRRPNPGDIDNELDKIGAEHNAFTSAELTGYWIKSSSNDFDIILDILSDIILNSLLKEEEVEKEKGVIFQEINMNEDTPQRKIIDDFLALVFGDQPAGWSIAGDKISVGGIKRADIISYHNKNYSAKNMTMIVSGNIKNKEALKKIDSFFKNFNAGVIIDSEKIKIAQESPRAKITDKKTDQSHLVLGVTTFDMFDERRYALNILSVILGGNTSAKLFMEIRQKLALAYSIWSSTWLQKDIGLLMIRAGLDNGKLDVAVKKILEILSDLKNNGVSAKELEDAKSFLRGQMALSLETSDQVADFFGEQELFYGKMMQPEEILEKIEKVTQDDILKVARDIFRPEKISMAVIGSHPDFSQKEEFYKNLLSKI
ncbi:MAG: pitrilysin family protein [Candidatus Paceibacterota bacterium]